MSDIRLKEGLMYWYFPLIGAAYNVEVVKVGKYRSLCKWEVIGLGGRYVTAGFKWNRRLS